MMTVPIQEMADEVYRSKILTARRMPASRKMGAGPQLFAEVLQRMRSGARLRYPDADERELTNILNRNLARLKAIEDYGIYRTPGTPPS